MSNESSRETEEKKDRSRVVLFKPDTRALVQLSASTSVVIATLLALPDAIGILPSTTSVSAWMFRLAGLWIIAAVLWFVGFTVILYSVRMIVKGVEVSDRGIKLWRFAKPLAWRQVDAVSVEPQKFFSKFFALPTIARRLTVFEKKKARGGKSRLVPHYLPSFFFDSLQFEILCQTVFQERFQTIPTSVDAFMAEAENLPRLQKTFGSILWQRVAISILIALGLGFWFYRKAISNYAYNAGSQAMMRGDYKTAREKYKWATEAEPTFAGAWNQLGNSEYHLGRVPEAAKDWEKSIQMKPDFVEPRISLSYLALKNRDYPKAKELIDSALNLNPLNPFALLNRCDYEMAMGHYRGALQDARLVMVQCEPMSGLWHTAACLLARGKVRVGESDDALHLLRTLPRMNVNQQAPQLNVGLRLTVSGETCLSLDYIDGADRFFTAALKLNPYDVDAIRGMASVHIARKQFAQARKEIDQVDKLLPGNPYTKLLTAKIDLAAGDEKHATEHISQVLTNARLDGCSLVEAGKLYVSMNQLDQAAFCAQRALRMDSEDRAAKKLLAYVAAQRETSVTK